MLFRKFVQKLNHTKLDVFNKDLFGKYYDAWLSFALELPYKLWIYFDEDTILLVKKMLFGIIFKTLPFRVYNHLINCCRVFYIYSKCTFCTRFHIKERALSVFLNKTLPLLPDFFPSAITEDITLENAVFLSIHYHGIICSCRENNYGNCGVIYYECLNSHFCCISLF